MSRIVYYPGGYIPSAPNENKAEQYDESGYTRWDGRGNVIATRSLTPDEIEALKPLVIVLTPEQKIEAAASALAGLDGITAPVLPLDVLEILTDVRTALEG